MIKSLKITNFRGEELKIELADPWEHGLIIQSIDGIGPVNATINTTEIATTDGSRFNSARLSQRNIVLYFVFEEVIHSISGIAGGAIVIPDGGIIETGGYQITDVDMETIEDIRHKTYKYFPLKKQLTLEFETDTRTLQISGYVESNTPSIFSEREGCQISIICPDPYFYDAKGVKEVEFGTHDPLLQFPISNERGGTDTYSNADTSGGYGLDDMQLVGGTTLRITSRSATDTITYKASEDGTWDNPHTETISMPSQSIMFPAYDNDQKDKSHYTRLSMANGISWLYRDVGRISRNPEKNIVYEGDADTGIVIVMHAYGNVSKPTILNTQTNELMTVDTTMQDGDEIVISTIKGQKSATKIRSGVPTNILSSLGQNIPWFTLSKGDNAFYISALSGVDSLETRIRFNTLYEGV